MVGTARRRFFGMGAGDFATTWNCGSGHNDRAEYCSDPTREAVSELASPARLERATCRLEIGRSIPLSYGDVVEESGIEPLTACLQSRSSTN
jgi:hypothetical protein